MLGEIIVYWRNYFGDLGALRLETIRTNADNLNASAKQKKPDEKKSLDVQLVDSTRLILEKPQMVKFRLDNMTKNYMKL